ncbi:Uncharacterised protein [uncultured archaeon]|nr:Uncharacterised protein [uncultured archaeon]
MNIESFSHEKNKGILPDNLAESAESAERQIDNPDFQKELGVQKKTFTESLKYVSSRIPRALFRRLIPRNSIVSLIKPDIEEKIWKGEKF